MVFQLCYHRPKIDAGGLATAITSEYQYSEALCCLSHWVKIQKTPNRSRPYATASCSLGTEAGWWHPHARGSVIDFQDLHISLGFGAPPASAKIAGLSYLPSLN